ncbi:MAG TPA: Hpt domain-containing protein [Rariglobus sp.]|jgi:HPt (histidine-containing phosphotransfer) domain-containing protein|nr:Hpt domain-containing protein [Rariglobus sp.]
MLNSQVIDPEAIASLRALSPNDDDGFLKEILGIFMDDTPLRIAELHASRTSGDVATFTRAAHSIKGSSSNVGAIELRTVAEQLEHRSRQHGLDDLEELVAELEAAFIRTRAELTKLVA